MENLEAKIMTSGLDFTSSNLKDLGLSSYSLERVVDSYNVGKGGVFYSGSKKPEPLNPNNFPSLNEIQVGNNSQMGLTSKDRILIKHEKIDLGNLDTLSLHDTYSGPDRYNNLYDQHSTVNLKKGSVYMPFDESRLPEIKKK